MSVLRSGGNNQLNRGFLRTIGPLGLALVILIGALGSSASAAAAMKTVRYRGYSVRVPASWPVYRLSDNAQTCVRFNRHAVYLGTPSAAQRCPAHAAGRTEAILVAPSATIHHGGFQTQAASAPALVTGATGRETRLTDAAHGVTVTATWNRSPGLIEGALHVRSLTRGPAAHVASSTGFQAQARRVAHATGNVYTGPGFDACSTPSQNSMNAWRSSPYRALGVYIGGANSACAQPNLNSTWMATQSAAGWHMIPIYVGLQAPSNTCGCAAISSSRAASQGTAAAQDAVTQAQAVGIGAGNPIYNDMEGYPRGGSNSTAVMNFLAAWTTQLHAEGYVSGIYSSGGSGIADLVSRYGTTYSEPDDIWVADWNGSASTSDPYLPANDWPSHQRLHQYSGAHNETYGGVRINIDGDYLDAATAGGGSATPAAAPSLSVSPTSSGIVQLAASWPGISGITTWRTLGGTNPTALGSVDNSPLRGVTTTIAEHSAFPYYAIQALTASGQVIGTSSTVPTRPHVVLYGHSVFVPRTGITGVPAGCFTGAACQLSATVTSGRRLVASASSERLNSSGGLLFFSLNATGRRLLAHTRGRRLPVRIIVRDVSGRSASALMNLVPYTTVGSGPRRSASPASTLRLLGKRDFVLRGATGGILATCTGAAPCLVTTKISAAHQTVATTKPEFMGANSAVYLSYRLTGYGRSLLARAKGNQLGVRVVLSDATATAVAHISLSSFR
ncbi:MAG: DUF1906 domain-containing protein [Solirubrobacteraceae bacterium]